MKPRMTRRFLLVALVTLTISLSACGFHLQGERHFAPLLQTLYLKSNDPYGHLARQLQQLLKSSNVRLVSSKDQASAQLNILHDEATQTLLSVSSTQQTRQYTLMVSVTFDITDAKGRQLLSPQTLTESRVITVQSNQILGSSNEATLLYQQMRRMLAYAIINRISSQEVTAAITKAQSTS